MTMQIYGRNVEVTEALRHYVEDKLAKLSGMLRHTGDLRPQVVLEVKRDQHKVEVTLPLNGLILRAEAATDDMYASVDKVLDKLTRQADRYKARYASNRRPPAEPDAEPLEGVPAEAQVIKVKRFAAKPQTLEEAILQMDLLGHDFYLFRDPNRDLRLLYRRNDGGYGLIEPVL